jgi:hypothetical protein
MCATITRTYDEQRKLNNRPPDSMASHNTLGCGSSAILRFHGDHVLNVEVKELPNRRRLWGVDVGGEDAAWLEKKD